MKFSRRTFAILMICLLNVGASEELHIVQRGESDSVEIIAAKPGAHKVEIDDAPGFRVPVATVRFNGLKTVQSAKTLGLIPGVKYHVRLEGSKEVKDFRLRIAAFVQPEVNCETLRRTWEVTGRLMTGVAFSGVRWDPAVHAWLLRPRNYLIGQSIYNAELFLRPALDAASACDDLSTLDEVAQYYALMLQQTEPLGTLLKKPNVAQFTRARMEGVDPSARTFVAPFGDEVGDGELYNAQWIHPAARLLRLISLLPPRQRTPAMKSFAAKYAKFIVEEQLKRYLVEQKLPAPGGGPPVARIELWKLAMRGLKGREPWDTAMSDIDLWLLASAAEVLGANANDSALVRLSAGQIAMLRLALQTGVQFFETKRTSYPAVKNFAGTQVGSASYFNGDYTAHADYDFSAVTTEGFPSPAQRKVLSGASWDISHAYRIPIFLRSLYENRKATGLDFPRYHDLELVANQYVYRVFNGNFSRPLFHNYLDGSDGWHRVGFNGQNFGYPPSQYCDMHSSNQPCLLPGNIIGWGQLAFVNPDLLRLEQALVALGFDEKPDAREFRDRYYFYGQQPYQMTGIEGQQIYGTALYFVIAENAAMLGGRPQGGLTASIHLRLLRSKPVFNAG